MPASFSKVMKGQAAPNKYQAIGYKYMEMVYKKFDVPTAWRQLGTEHGWARWEKHKGHGCVPVVAAPNPTTPTRLYILIHEVGHIILGHWKNGLFTGCGRKMTDIDSTHEYEAESYALAAMKHEGIALPESVLQNAYWYVASFIVSDMKAGHRINTKALAFAQKGVDAKGNHFDPALHLPAKAKACLTGAGAK